MKDDQHIQELRDFFPVTKSWIYLYNGGINACPKPVGDAIRRFIEKWETDGRDAWPGAFEDFKQLKHAFGRLIGTDGERIVITESTTAGINTVAQIIQPRPEQNVIVTDLEYMSDTYPWIVSHPAEVRFMPDRNGRIVENDLINYLDANTAVVCVSAVTVGSGYRVDLEKLHQIASKFDVPMLVDGAQAVGMVPIDVKTPRLDFLVGTASKWLFGPTGVGFLYVGDRYINATPPGAGWLAAENRNDWDLHNPKLFNNAMRFQGGIPNLIGAVGALAGIRLIEEIGLDFIQARVRYLTQFLLNELDNLGLEIWTPQGDHERAGIVFFRHPHAKALYEKLKEERIFTGCFLGGIRLDVHFFNTLEELEKAITVIKSGSQ